MPSDPNSFERNTASAAKETSITWSTTFDPVVNLHEVTDERLEALVTMNRNSDWDFFLACVGIAVGFSQNAFSVATNVYSGMPVAGWDVIAGAVFLLALGVGARSYFSWKKGKGDLRAALDEVRSRPKRHEAIQLTR